MKKSCTFLIWKLGRVSVIALHFRYIEISFLVYWKHFIFIEIMSVHTMLHVVRVSKCQIDFWVTTGKTLTLETCVTFPYSTYHCTSCHCHILCLYFFLFQKNLETSLFLNQSCLVLPQQNRQWKFNFFSKDEDKIAYIILTLGSRKLKTAVQKKKKKDIPRYLGARTKNHQRYSGEKYRNILEGRWERWEDHMPHATVCAYCPSISNGPPMVKLLCAQTRGRE